MKSLLKHPLNITVVSLLLSLLPTIGISQASAQQNAKTAMACISDYPSIYAAYSCVDEIAHSCLETTGRNSNNEMTCLGLETSAWDEVYLSSLYSLREATSRRGVEGASAALEDSVRQYNQSYLRSCAFETGRWPEHALLRRIDSFVCVRDGAAERAIQFFFWNREIRVLMGE